MDYIMFWIDTQRRWCTLTSYNYLGQFNNFNKLRQYDWSKAKFDVFVHTVVTTQDIFYPSNKGHM